MSSEQICLLLIMIWNFMWLQMNVVIIGNRENSMHYKSHLLVKKIGLAKLIYFKPQHFHRYSIWEVIAFFLSYIQLIVLIILFALSFVYESIGKIGLIIAITLCFSFFLVQSLKLYTLILATGKKKNP